MNIFRPIVVILLLGLLPIISGTRNGKVEMVWEKQRCCGEYTSSYHIYSPDQCKMICNVECVGYTVSLQKTKRYKCTVFETFSGTKPEDISECHYFPHKDTEGNYDGQTNTSSPLCLWPAKLLR